MVLTDEEAEQFYDLWISLLDFVNQKYKLIKELYGMTSPKGLPLKSVAFISSKLWEDKDIIDEFVLSGFKKMDEEEIAIVSSWKRAIHGKFIVDRHLRKGSVLISVDNNEVYVVKGIYSSWKEILGGYPMPQIVEATLMPFRDVIIHDGIVAPYGVCLVNVKSYALPNFKVNVKSYALPNFKRRFSRDACCNNQLVRFSTTA